MEPTLSKFIRFYMIADNSNAIAQAASAVAFSSDSLRA
jgi:hypothetical protein